MSGLTGLIRVDGSDTIGMGHVMRCLYLARELFRVAQCRLVFVMRQLPMGSAWVERQGYPVVSIPADAGPADEVACVRDVIAHERPAFVVTDLRALTPGLVEAVKADGVMCVTIDEWGDRAVSTDILTNGTVVLAWHRYELEGDVRCLIGGRYALLDQQFVRAHDAPRRPHDGSARVLVALGGDDPFDLTSKAVESLELVRGPLAGIIVIGPAFTNQARIRDLVSSSRHRYEVHENTNRMADLMLWADVAITAGGLIALELACTGTAGLIVCEVDHQLDTAAVLESYGAALNLGLGDRLDPSELAASVTRLLEDPRRREAMSQAGRRLIDGRGCCRLAEAIVGALRARAA